MHNGLLLGYVLSRIRPEVSFIINYSHYRNRALTSGYLVLKCVIDAESRLCHVCSFCLPHCYGCLEKATGTKHVTYRGRNQPLIIASEIQHSETLPKTFPPVQKCVKSQRNVNKSSLVARTQCCTNEMEAASTRRKFQA